MQGIQVSVNPAVTNPDIVIVEISGYIDTTTSSELERILQNLLREQKFKLIIDLENVDYISSAGWGIFISEIKNIRMQHGDLKLACMSESVNEVYELLEFSTILTSSDTVENAVALFGGSSQAAAKAPVAPTKPAPAVPKPMEPAKPMNTPAPTPAPAPPISPKPIEVTPVSSPGNSTEATPTASLKLTLIDRIKNIVKSNPEWGSWKIKKELNRMRGNHSKVGWGEVRSELKYSKLNNKSARYRFARGA